MITHCTALHCVVTSDAHLLLTLQTVLLVVINYGVLVLPLVEFIDLLPRVRRVFERALFHCGLRARADSADEVRGADPVHTTPVAAHVCGHLARACPTGVACPLACCRGCRHCDGMRCEWLRRNGRVPRQADPAAPDAAIELSSAALHTRARPLNLATFAPGPGRRPLQCSADRYRRS